MRCTVVLILTSNDEASTDQGVKWISDNDFGYRNQGAMSPLPIVVVTAQLQCIR